MWKKIVRKKIMRKEIVRQKGRWEEGEKEQQGSQRPSHLVEQNFSRFLIHKLSPEFPNVTDNILVSQFHTVEMSRLRLST